MHDVGRADRLSHGRQDRRREDRKRDVQVVLEDVPGGDSMRIDRIFGPLRSDRARQERHAMPGAAKACRELADENLDPTDVRGQVVGDD